MSTSASSAPSSAFVSYSSPQTAAQQAAAQQAQRGYQAQYGMTPQVQEGYEKMHPKEGHEKAKVEVCETWTSPFKCALTIFTFLAIIMFVYMIYYIFSVSSRATNSASFWIVSIISLLIYVGVAFLFGWWIKKDCEECKYGTSWFVFIIAIFFPIILGFLVSIFIGAFAGGVSYLSGSLGKGGYNKKKAPPSPGGVPSAPVTTQAAQALAAQQAAAQQSAAQQSAQTAQAAAQQAATQQAAAQQAGSASGLLSNLRNIAPLA